MFKTIKKELINKPPGTEFVHASSHLVLKDGTVLLAWFAGSKEGNDDVSIYYSRKKNNYWTKALKLQDHIHEAHWNPVFFSLSDKKQILFYKVGEKIHQWRTYFCISCDEGQTFSQPEELVPGDHGGRGPVRNKPIRLSNGDIAAPSSMENGIWHAFVDLSENEGLSWMTGDDVFVENILFDSNKIKIPDSSVNIPVSDQSYFGRGVIQPSLWESNPGNVHMLLRSTEGCLFRSDSPDFGRTWTGAYKTDLPNNNSGIDLVKLSSGELILIYNPVKENWGMRSPLSLAVSRDNGTTWDRMMDLDSGPGEFSYPSVTSSGNSVFISYSYKREAIAFCELEFSW